MIRTKARRSKPSRAAGFIVDARADLGDVSRVIGADLRAISDAEEVDTLGGLITALAGHVPVRGEIIVEDGIEFEVTDADPRRVKRVKIRMTEAPVAIRDTARIIRFPTRPRGHGDAPAR